VALIFLFLGCGDDAPGSVISIEDIGTTDLDFDGTAILDPRDGLPSLDGVDPVYTPALADQELPDAGTEILELDKVIGLTGYGSEDELAEKLREDGVVRQTNVSSMDLMAGSLAGVSLNYSHPGVLVTSDALFNTFHNFFDNLLLGVELRSLRPRVLAMLRQVKLEAAKRFPAGKPRMRPWMWSHIFRWLNRSWIRKPK
jgi:hypothetical protein